MKFIDYLEINESLSFQDIKLEYRRKLEGMYGSVSLDQMDKRVKKLEKYKKGLTVEQLKEIDSIIYENEIEKLKKIFSIIL